MNFDKPFWASVLRESDGTPSISRLLSSCIVCAALAWITFLMGRNKALPDLQPIGIFVSSTILALYGVNRVTAAATAIFSDKPACDPPVYTPSSPDTPTTKEAG